MWCSTSSDFPPLLTIYNLWFLTLIMERRSERQTQFSYTSLARKHMYKHKYPSTLARKIITVSVTPCSLFLVYQARLYPEVWIEAHEMPFLQIRSQLHLEVVWNVSPIRFPQMGLSLDALAAQTRFQSVFCITCNVTHSDNVSSRVTAVHPSGWVGSTLLLCGMEDNTRTTVHDDESH